MDPMKEEHHAYAHMLKVTPDRIEDANYVRLMHMQGLTEEIKSQHHIQVNPPHESKINRIPDAQDIPRCLLPEVRGQERPPLSESRVAVSEGCQAESNPMQGPVSTGQHITPTWTP